jgi:hypothetical protein
MSPSQPLHAIIIVIHGIIFHLNLPTLGVSYRFVNSTYPFNKIQSDYLKSISRWEWYDFFLLQQCAKQMNHINWFQYSLLQNFYILISYILIHTKKVSSGWSMFSVKLLLMEKNWIGGAVITQSQIFSFDLKRT